MNITKINNTVLLKYHNVIYNALILFLLMLFFIPLFNSGYYGDDSINSFIKGSVGFNNTTVNKISNDIFNSWINDAGRFNPLSFYVYFFFYYCTSLVAYKIIIFIFILLNLFTFSYWLKINYNNVILNRIPFLLLLICLQFRIYHDPVLSFHFLIQLIFFYSMLSTICMEKFFKSQSIFYGIISIILNIFGLLTYFELFFVISFSTLFLSIYNIKFNKRKIYYIFTLLFFVTQIILFLINIYLRLTHGSAYSGTSIEINIINMSRTFYYQFTSAFPLIYAINNFNLLFDSLLKTLTWYNILSTIIFAFLFFITLNNLKFKNQHNKLLIIFIVFSVFPSILVAISEKYQNELILGLGYLPVYYQYFGHICLFLYLFFKFNINNKFKQYLITFFITMIYFINMSSNISVVNSLNNIYYYPRITLQSFLKNFKFEQFNENINIIQKIRHPYDDKGFYFMYINKRINLHNSDTYYYSLLNSKKKLIIVDNIKNAYMLDYNADLTRGIVYWAKLDRIEIIDNINVLYYVNNIYIYKTNLKRYDSFICLFNSTKNQDSSSFEIKLDKMTDFYFYISSLNKHLLH